MFVALFNPLSPCACERPLSWLSSLPDAQAASSQKHPPYLPIVVSSASISATRSAFRLALIVPLPAYVLQASLLAEV